MMSNPWIGVDWGTTNLRAWHVDPDGEVMAHRRSGDGAASLSPDGFERSLLMLCNDWFDNARITPVIVSGMAGAAEGWMPAPYRSIPCRPLAPDCAISPPVRDPRLRVSIIAGLAQHQPTHDVMRGEETQIGGVLVTQPQFDGVACLPGTHTKWVLIRHGEVVQFRSSMTGEIFELLRTYSTLRGLIHNAPIDEEEFDAALDDGFSHPHSLLADLFAIRASALLSDLAPTIAVSRLSGLLIGCELSGCQSYWQHHPLTLIGDSKVCALYRRGLSRLGITAMTHDVETATIAGLVAARRLIAMDTR